MASHGLPPAKAVRINPIFYNRLQQACGSGDSGVANELEIMARVLDDNGPVVAKFQHGWDDHDIGRMPSRGPEWRTVDVVLDDRSLCVISAREHPELVDVVEIRDLILIADPS